MLKCSVEVRRAVECGVPHYKQHKWVTQLLANFLSISLRHHINTVTARHTSKQEDPAHHTFTRRADRAALNWQQL